MRIAVFFSAIVATLIAVTSATAQYPVAGITATGRSLHAQPTPPGRSSSRAPTTSAPANVADVIVHFHGDPQTFWNNAKWANLNAIIVTVNYSGLSSAYTNAVLDNYRPVSNRSSTRRSPKSVPNPTSPTIYQWDKIAVSSFSAGYGAVREILKSSTYRDKIDSLLAADSLYASTAGDGTPLDSQMADYKTFATLRKERPKTFLFSHSQVLTFTYENTAETGDELMQYLGIISHQLRRQRPRHAQLLPPCSDRQLPPLGCRRRHRPTTTSNTSATSATSSKNSPSPNYPRRLQQQRHRRRRRLHPLAQEKWRQRTPQRRRHHPRRHQLRRLHLLALPLRRHLHPSHQHRPMASPNRHRFPNRRRLYLIRVMAHPRRRRTGG